MEVFTQLRGTSGNRSSLTVCNSGTRAGHKGLLKSYGYKNNFGKNFPNLE